MLSWGLFAPRRARLGPLLLAATIALTSCDSGSTQAPNIERVSWTRITPSAASPADRPDWRGDSLVFESRASGRSRLAICRADGSELQFLPALGSEEPRDATWVGPSIVLYSSDLMGTRDLWYWNLAGATARRLTDFPGDERDPAPHPWNPALAYIEAFDSLGGRIAFLPDTTARPLVPRHLTPAGLSAAAPSFDPSGEILCFEERESSAVSHIWIAPFQGMLTQLTTGPYRDRSPRFGPGGRIFFVSDRGGSSALWSVSLQGEGAELRRWAIDEPGAELRSVAMPPSGDRVIVSSDRGGERALWLLSNLGY